MRAAVLRGPGRIELADLPDPMPGPGDVVLRVGANAICGSDRNALRGNHPKIHPPAVLGHEFAGTVSALGPDVESWRIGDRVCVEPLLSRGRCRYCLTGRGNVCQSFHIVGDGMDGALATYVKIPSKNLFKLPDRVSFEEGALVQPLAISYHAVRDRAEVSDGELVVVIGAGPIGLGALLAARSFGARTIVSDVLGYRLEFARKLGADRVVDGTWEDLVAVVQQENEGYGADVVVEAVGGGQEATFDLAVRAAAPGARVVVLGSFARNEAKLRIVDFKFGELDIRGSQGHPNTFRPVLDLVALGAIPARELITHRVPLEDAPEAFRLLDTRDEGVMKVIVTP
ncbi:MAG: alcohol dehydrogenase catalytic domain-containing protein [Chloroflexi bacterium]|nr:alcohol dehydrogenase catalytic domain-containing protein [Chloroflexota bacterium]